MEGGESATDAEHKETKCYEDRDDEVIVAAECEAVEIWPTVKNTNANNVWESIDNRRKEGKETRF